MSRSLHSSMEYLGGSNRWSRNDRDMEPEKSSIGEISSKISSRPEVVGTSLRARLGGGGHARLPDRVAEQPVEALGLQRQEVGDLEGLADLGEGDTAGGRTEVVPELSRTRCARQPKRGPSTGLTELELSARPAPAASGTWLGAATWVGHGSHREGSPRTPGLGNRSGHHEALERTEVAGRGSAKRQHTRAGHGCPVESSPRPRAPARSP